MALSTTTTSFSSSTTATAPVLAFRTPFPQPASCSSPPLTGTSDPRYTACLAPAGDQFTFSPAVCPKGWTAWWLNHVLPTPYVSTEVVSTAYCCAPGYSITYQPYASADLSDLCSHVDIRTTSSSGAAFPSEQVLAVSRLPAWHISWKSNDVPTLTPKPPVIDQVYRKWVPGSDPEEMPSDMPDLGKAIGMGVGFLLAGIAGLVLLCVCCHTRCCRGTKRGWSRGKRATPAPAPAPAPATA